MKKLFLLLSIVCLTAFAEASFEQIEGLIEKQQYAAAEAGLEGIIKNHPNSAKAYYAMAQAQAGLGNQEKARFALNKARGIDPELSFVGRSSVEKLEMAITPQVKNIEPVTDSHFWRNLFIFFALIGFCYWAWNKYWRDDEGDKAVTPEPKPTPPDSPSDQAYAREMDAKAKERMAKFQESATAAKTNSDQQAKMQAAQNAYVAPTYVQPAYAPAPTQTVIHHTSSNDGLLTGMVLGQMLGDHHHHDTTRVVEREVIREVPAAPAPSRDSSWDTPAPSRSSSWDDSSSSKSSSWDTPSSSSSSWGSSSSSSSDSSWSSSSDSSSSSSDSSSSWD